MSNLVSTSGKRIKELLLYHGHTLAQMSLKTGIEKSSLSNYINEKRLPRQDRIKIISDKYNVSPAWLMGFDVPMNEVSAEEIYNMLDLLNASDREMVVKLIEHLAERKKDEHGETTIGTLQNKKTNRRKKV